MILFLRTSGVQCINPIKGQLCQYVILDIKRMLFFQIRAFFLIQGILTLGYDGIFLIGGRFSASAAVRTSSAGVVLSAP